MSRNNKKRKIKQQQRRMEQQIKQEWAERQQAPENKRESSLPVESKSAVPATEINDSKRNIPPSLSKSKLKQNLTFSGRIQKVKKHIIYAKRRATGVALLFTGISLFLNRLFKEWLRNFDDRLDDMDRAYQTDLIPLERNCLSRRKSQCKR